MFPTFQEERKQSTMQAVKPTHQFLLDEDQEARRAELMAFIGPNADKFMPTYDSMRARLVAPAGGKKPKIIRGFVAAAFFLGPVWFLYRKMWMVSLIILGVVVVFALLPIPGGNRIGLPIGIALAISGKYTYVEHAMKRIIALRGASPVADLSVLAKEGGVSKPAGYISAAALVGLMILMVALVVLSGQDPNAFR
ncbi:DUF2628 domain-containing protein [Silvibacterium dinghuense]|nr:DUF2628 domain-containing protein [Silvibacterium dinghuense]